MVGGDNDMKLLVFCVQTDTQTLCYTDTQTHERTEKLIPVNPKNIFLAVV